MRKFFSLATATILGISLSVSPAYAQGLDIGAEAGLNVSDLSVDADGESVDTSAETGFRFGGILRFDFSPVVGFQTGASFSQKGATDESTGTGPEAAIEFEYLEVPVLLNVNIPTGPAPVQPRLYGGGNVSFELSCDVTASGDGVDASAACDDPTSGLGVDTRSADFGLLVGGGLDFPAGPGAFAVDARYEFGLTDVADDDADVLEIKNRNLQAVAGYTISIP